jgi:SAM-dependent methyltransferase
METDNRFLAEQHEIVAASSYEDLFVPVLFGPWAPRVADSARIASGQRILDVACGTGVLAREAVERVGPTGFVAGVDTNAGMLEVAARLEPSVEWHQASAESLPFSDGRFDTVISQFGLMLFRDRGRALGEMRRVVAYGGGVVVAVWDALEANPGYAAEVELLERTAGSDAADALRAPFVLGDRDGLTELFRQSEFADIDVRTETTTAVYPNIRTMVEAELRGWLPAMGVQLGERLIENILHVAEEDLAQFLTPEGQVSVPTSAHIVSARTT